MSALAKYVASLGNARLLTVRAVAFEVAGFYHANQDIYGTLDVTAPDLPEGHVPSSDPRSTEADRHALAQAYVKRYGQGIAPLWKQDLSVLPAISLIPTPDAAKRGFFRGDDSRIGPTEAMWREWGVPVVAGTPVSLTDQEDYKALSIFQEEFVLPRLLAMATPVATAQPTPLPNIQPTPISLPQVPATASTLAPPVPTSNAAPVNFDFAGIFGQLAQTLAAFTGIVQQASVDAAAIRQIRDSFSTSNSAPTIAQQPTAPTKKPNESLPPKNPKKARR